MAELTGKKVVVTGGARRIGRAIALRLHEEGARVLIHYNSSLEDARKTAEECGGAPLLRADLASVDDIKAMFAHVGERYGPLYGLVNNAARFEKVDPLELSEQQWDAMQAVNVRAAFFCSQQAAPLMKPEGRIVNISSMGAFLPWAEHAHYCASKAALVSVTRSLAKALAPAISVNSVAPGVIPFEEAATAPIEALVRATPLKRAGTGAEIAEAVVYFLKATAFTTGQVLQVDGGLGLR